MNKNNFIIGLVVIIAMSAGIYTQQAVMSDTDTLKPQKSVIEFSLPDLSGKQHQLSEWQNKLQIINFWATWCPPCLKEIPEFIKLQNKFKDKNIQFIGIAIDDKDSVQTYLQTININYPILIAGDEGLVLAQQLGNNLNALPFTLIIDRQGLVIHRQTGELHTKELLEIIKPYI